MIYLQLFYEFFKTGLLAVGGGLATLPFLKQIAQTHDWFSIHQLTDMIAISESTPGPIGINMATYAGFHAAGIPGAITATLSLILPSYIIILIVSHFMEKFSESKLVKNAFYGIRPATIGLIAGAMFEVFVLSLLNVDAFTASGSFASLFQLAPILFYIISLIAIFKFSKWHPVIFIVFGAIVGIIFQL